MLKEILGKCGIEEEKANEIVKAMNEAKLYTTNLENVDIRYSKLQEQNKELKDANKNYETQLADFQKNNADVEALNKMVEQLKLSNKELEVNHKAEMDKLQFNFALEGALNNAKSKNNKALMALLDMNSIKYQEGKLEGLQEQIEALQKDASYLFNLEAAPSSTGSIGQFGRNGGKFGVTKKEFDKMSYSERMNLYKNDKATYDKLVSE